MNRFVQEYWEVIETRKYIHNWHLDVIGFHLEEVLKGNLNRLIINIPPRHCKSLMTSVFLTPYAWQFNPGLRLLYSSYSGSLSLRDSVKTRRIIESDLFQTAIAAKWPDFELTGDQNTKVRYENSYGGIRIATSTEGSLTGEGGDLIVVDDPHNVAEVSSDSIRNATLEWWDQAMSTRLNDPKCGAFVIIMQRSHENDLTGHLLAKNQGWYLLKIPARYEGVKQICDCHPEIEDPRTEIDEPLWPSRFPEDKLKELEEDLGAYGAAGQLQQRPAPRLGAMFDATQFTVVEALPSKVKETVRYWDKAGTAGGGAYTVGVKMGVMEDGRFVILNVVRGRWGTFEREKIIQSVTKVDGQNTTVWVEQEPGSAGKDGAKSTILNLAGWRVYADRPTGDKVERADPYSVQVNAGNVLLLKAEWNRPYIQEHAVFPNGKYKDQVDASSGAFNRLVFSRVNVGAWGRR